MPLVRIRLALHGCLNRPFYHIVVATNKSKRDGKHLEQVGCYDPMPNYNKEVIVGLNLERIKYWLSVGAQPTVAVHKLLGLAGVLPINPRLYLDAARRRQNRGADSAEHSEASDLNRDNDTTEDTGIVQDTDTESK